MKTILFWCLIFLFTGLPIYLLYWNLFRPVLIKRLQYRLFKCRDDLRMMLVSGAIGEKEKAYPIVEKYCNKAIAKIEHVDLGILFFRKRPDQRIMLEVERDFSLIFESIAPLRQCFIQINFAIVGVACANSPGLLVLMAPLLVLVITALWFNKMKCWLVNIIKEAFGALYLQPA
jgi:hypothetical protein